MIKTAPILLAAIAILLLLRDPDSPISIQSSIEQHNRACPGIDYPAIMSIYDPDLGPPNCDEDCATVATGPLEDWMYEVAGACPARLLGATISFPAINHTLQCVDNGSAIRASWSERDDQCVVYFDTLWHLEKEGEEILGAPYWTWWFIEDWSVTWER